MNQVQNRWSILSIQSTSDAIPTLFDLKVESCSTRFKLFLSKSEAERVLEQSRSTIELEMNRGPLNVRVMKLKDSYLYSVDSILTTQGLSGVQVKDGKPIYACWFLPWPDEELMNLSEHWKGYQVHLRDDGELTYTVYNQPMQGCA